MIYTGINNIPKPVKDIYVGVNGTNKVVKDLYTSDSGILKKIYSKAPETTKYTTSDIITIPNGVNEIEIFCVGGGAGGGGARYVKSWYLEYAQYEWESTICGSGGGGGYTTTTKVKVKPGDKVGISIGAGGSGERYILDTSSMTWNQVKATSGGDTIVTINDEVVATAKGGNINGSGGSGGGHGQERHYNYTTSGSYVYSSSEWISESNGGIDGADGGSYTYKKGDNVTNKPGASGQGSTTRAFGEEDGALYSPGGNGGKIYNKDAPSAAAVEPGTGAGGNGANINAYGSDTSIYNTREYGGDGADGAVLIRW